MRSARRARSVSSVVSVAGAAVIWIALLGPVITLIARMSPGDIWSALTGPGDLDPLVTSVDSAVVTLAVLACLCTPLEHSRPELVDQRVAHGMPQQRVHPVGERRKTIFVKYG